MILCDKADGPQPQHTGGGTVSLCEVLDPHPSSVFREVGFVDRLQRPKNSGEHCGGILYWL